ncbi:MAG: H4MPT-linked C1 transfer pathway protein [Candidatus Bathyarchaeota archaeon]|nr:H4MPT-linked C1 transfer pathway protein [Candidatus Bathyarchaeota archaeon]
MATVVGWDIGGANTKAVLLRTENGCVEEIRTAIEYFPIWKAPEKLTSVLTMLKKRISGSLKLDGIGLTMTAELSDAFRTKREGVNHILTCSERAFVDLPVFVLNVDAMLKSMGEARCEPLKVAAANWVATGWLIAQLAKNCVVVDVGSTSTSIIPVVNGFVSGCGKTDFDKLIVGELVYTGILRTNVAAIVSSVPLRGVTVRVASELFALSGDVHRILGNISEKDYITETTDGRGKTRRDALARLARVVCADIEMLKEGEIVQIAKYVHSKQIEQVAEGLCQVCSRVRSLAKSRVPVVVTGAGKDFIARSAAQNLGVDEIIEFEKLCFGDAFVYRIPQSQSTIRNVAKATPAIGVAMMVASKLEGRLVKWTL